MHMNDQDLDHILSRENAGHDIVPSSGFVSSVMDAVHHEAATPPPLPFPWKRALPGLIASLALAMVMIVSVVRFGVHTASQLVPAPSTSRFSAQLFGTLTHVFDASVQMGAGWVLLALLLSLVTVRLSMRLAGVKF
jgi:hypothetical protein